ncbi:MAG: DNA repair protein RecO [Deltaproteobacteria bacterium RIFCSPLOWO2_01_44_7]|nr:MAG: DNA repair protein RecO [Deltaproteobacteria bacterium RIFCSPHIGHO2_01_FULL_43_49]OGQ15617.1 MAG: DNA repair protein RecO [Deltaproteobacteria bacterium RIFCSPHIGHO2_02_FULL_44_53]OGQ28321.1 MAG: DNA repair protein RecO [Deltaproteobacteria bacterium RIFCSPHIGHO2_12_FULL_44_21]OGQ31908.1 MAG: DNA repair protein RecO [Deltaproteobacteria bacterium RIFCSPLOWO2_01_FULL_45_74]OGQ37596.1 MAG: DNA repair protein RecO [Deltaproteobacteria bacterium RIFCSPLOWO2_01_44_7]OGQ43524.1 MAG: DNA repa
MLGPDFHDPTTYQFARGEQDVGFYEPKAGGGVSLKTDQAIVLRHIKYGDADLIVSLLTKEEGKIGGLAKGARRSKKRFGSSLEIGSHLHVVFEADTKRDLVFLKETSLLKGNPQWRKSLVSIAAVGFALELVAKTLPEKHPSVQKFECLERFLENLNEKGSISSLMEFQLEWLSLSGWQANLESCGICGIRLKPSKEWEALQKILDHYWLHILGKPLVSRKLLDTALLV